MRQKSKQNTRLHIPSGSLFPPSDPSTTTLAKNTRFVVFGPVCSGFVDGSSPVARGTVLRGDVLIGMPIKKDTVEVENKIYEKRWGRK